MDQPIEVNGTTLPAVAATILRYGLTLLGSFAVGKGWVDAESLPGIVVMVLTVATGVWGVVKARSNGDKLVTLANAVPNSVAVVK